MEGAVLCIGGFILLIILTLSGMWIGSAMLLVGFLGCLLMQKSVFLVFGLFSETLLSTLFQYTLTVVPLFVFMGNVLHYSELGRDVFNAAFALTRGLYGALPMAVVLACGVFAAVTGLSAPALVTIGLLGFSEMRRLGYPLEVASGIIAISAPLAFLIPPSVSFVIYGLMTEQSIGKLFIAGVIPGCIFMGLLALNLLVVGKFVRFKRDDSFMLQGGNKGRGLYIRVKYIFKIWHVVAIIVIIFAGIYKGIITPTEAAAVGSALVVFIGLVGRKLDFDKLWLSLRDTVNLTGMFVYLLVAAYIFSKFVLLTNFPFVLANKLVEIKISPHMFLLIIAIVYVFLGMFSEIVSALVMTLPIVYPCVVRLGIDPIWFGVFLTLLVQVGVITPPVGLDVYVLARVIGIPPERIFRGVTIFLPSVFVLIVLIVVFPDIVLWLPKKM